MNRKKCNRVGVCGGTRQAQGTGVGVGVGKA